MHCDAPFHPPRDGAPCLPRPAAPRWAAARWAALALALALAPAVVAAQPYDPGLTWRTIDTEHFRVHFHDGLGPLARRVAAAAERAHATLVPPVSHAPSQRTEIVLSDDSDDPNGSATPLPYDTIRLYAVPPPPMSELGDERDWLQALVTHEYTHVLHLDTVEGWPARVNAVFGKVLTPSIFAPPLVIEGLAVLHEAGEGAGADGGRNANALFDMYARALTEDGPFPSLDVAVGQPLAWPRGNIPYLLGGRFMAYVRSRGGDAAIAAFVADAGAQLWPWRLGTMAERHLGAGPAALWAGFEAEVRADADAQRARVRERPVTVPRAITRRGFRVLHPRWVMDGGELAYYDAGPDERPGLRRVTAAGQDLGRFATVWDGGTFGVAAPWEVVVAEQDLYRGFDAYGDLYRVSLKTGARQRLTWGERASDPDVSADGRRIVYAAHLPGGETALRELPIEGGTPRTLLHLPGVQVSGPRLAPDGKRVALELQENGRRDVAVWDGQALAFVTDDDALDVAPAWSADGRTLFFSSERTGVYDLYAFDLATDAAGATPAPPPADGRRRVPGRLWQVTNVESGACEPAPSPDGATLAFVTYSRRGFDLASIPLDRATWLEPAPVRARPLRGPEAPPPPPAPDLPDRPYRALDTVGPSFWFPVLGLDGDGLTAGAITAGADVLLRHAWVAQGWYGLNSHEPGYDAVYVGSWMYPRLLLESRRVVGVTTGLPESLEERWTLMSAALYFSHEMVVSAATGAASAAIGWRALRLRALGPAPQVVEVGAEPYRDGVSSEWSLFLSHQDSARFVNAISPEEGRHLELWARGADRDLGGDFSYGLVHGAATQYLRLPLRHTVLALRAGAGAGAGTIGGRQPFELGGPAGSDLVSAILEPLVGAPIVPDQLRGYVPGAFGGATVLDGNLELRFPIANVERGYRLLPIQLRRVHGTLFADVGSATPAGASRMEPLRVGAGAELVTELLLGYQLRTDLRLGAAQGLGPLWDRATTPDPYATFQLYLALGFIY